MQLASTTPLKTRALALINNYSIYVEHTLGDTLDITTDTVATQLRAAAGKVDSREGLGAFISEALLILGDPDVGNLPGLILDDVTKIAEEVPLGVQHIYAITHPDVLFAALPRHKKHELTERAVVDGNALDVLRDLLHFNARANRAEGQPPALPANNPAVVSQINLDRLTGLADKFEQLLARVRTIAADVAKS